MSHVQIIPRFGLYLTVVIWCSGCGDADTTRSSSSGLGPLELGDATHADPAEAAAENLLSSLSRDELLPPRPTMPVHTQDSMRLLQMENHLAVSGDGRR